MRFGQLRLHGPLTHGRSPLLKFLAGRVDFLPLPPKRGERENELRLSRPEGSAYPPERNFKTYALGSKATSILQQALTVMILPVVPAINA
jgi:hypothetical protein